MPLNFFRLGRDTVLTVRVLEPSTWPEDFGILTPQRGGTVHEFHRDGNRRALSDCQVVDQLTTFRADGFRQRDNIIFSGLWKNAAYIMSEGVGGVEGCQGDVPREQSRQQAGGHGESRG